MAVTCVSAGQSDDHNWRIPLTFANSQSVHKFFQISGLAFKLSLQIALSSARYSRFSLAFRRASLRFARVSPAFRPRFTDPRFYPTVKPKPPKKRGSLAKFAKRNVSVAKVGFLEHACQGILGFWAVFLVWLRNLSSQERSKLEAFAKPQVKAL